VASKLDTEGAMLGQLVAQVLEARKVPVRSRLQLGPAHSLRHASLAGEVDL